MQLLIVFWQRDFGACLTQVFSHDWPWALPPACQPSLQRGVRGVSPRLKKKSASLFLPRSPPFVSRSLFLSFSFPPSAALSLAPVLADPPYPAGGPSLPGRRQADTPYLHDLPPGRRVHVLGSYWQPLLSYFEGGYSLFGRRTPLTREAPPPYSKGGPPPYSKGGHSLPERRILLTRKADIPYSRGGYSLLGRRILLTRACGCWCGVLA